MAAAWLHAILLIHVQARLVTHGTKASQTAILWRALTQSPKQRAAPNHHISIATDLAAPVIAAAAALVGGCDVGGSAAASLESTAPPPPASASVAETNIASLRLRVRCFAANVFCFACAMFFFMSHTYHCRPYHYSVFSLFEWATVVTNIMFHAVAATDMGELRDADVIVTDCWPAGADARELLPWQVTEAILDAGRAVFLPCPPVTRGQEVSTGAMAHPRCRVVEAKAWLLHAQNAVLEWCLAPAP